MARHRVLEHILPHVDDFRPVARMGRTDEALGLTPDPLLRLALIARDAVTLCDRLKLTNAETERLKALARHPSPSPKLRAPERDIVLYQLGEQIFRDGVRLAWARSRAAVDSRGWCHLLEAARAWQRPKFPVNGNDLIGRGVNGPAVGQALRELEDWWIASGFKPDKDELLARLPQIGRN